MDLKGRHFLTLKDFTPEEITYLLDLSAEFKRKKKEGIPVDHYRGKNVALIFEKTSTRTRCSFEVAAHDMGMGTTYLDPSGSQIGKKDTMEIFNKESDFALRFLRVAKSIGFGIQVGKEYYIKREEFEKMLKTYQGLKLEI